MALPSLDPSILKSFLYVLCQLTHRRPQQGKENKAVQSPQIRFGLCEYSVPQDL